MSAETSSHIYNQLRFYKDTKTTQRGEKNRQTNNAGTTVAKQ